jgi:DNA-binding NtrC family response regulator
MGWEATRQDEEAEGARILRLRPLRVLVVSADEPFRAVTAMLLSRRGCRAFSLTAPYAAAELAARERIDVVIVDGVERRSALAEELAITAEVAPAAGIVLVDGEEGTIAPDGERALPKWASFEQLFTAVERADRARAAARPLDAARSGHPWARGARALD